MVKKLERHLFFSYSSVAQNGVRHLQWKISYYRTFYGPILHFLVTFYSVYEVKCDQKVEYETIKCSIARISPLYH